MQIPFDCVLCDVTSTFEASDEKAIGNASWESCQCPLCGALVGTMRCDWGSPKVISTTPQENTATNAPKNIYPLIAASLGRDAAGLTHARGVAGVDEDRGPFFTMDLLGAVRDVLVRHGYPKPKREDLVQVQQALARVLFAPRLTP